MITHTVLLILANSIVCVHVFTAVSYSFVLVFLLIPSIYYINKKCTLEL